MTTTAEEDRQLRRVIQKTLRTQREEKAGRRRQARLRAGRIKEIEDRDKVDSDGGNPARAIWISFDLDRTMSDVWAGKLVRHRLQSVKFVLDDVDGDGGDAPEGMQSFSATDMGKDTRYPNRIGLNKPRPTQTIDEDEDPV